MSWGIIGDSGTEIYVEPHGHWDSSAPAEVAMERIVKPIFVGAMSWNRSPRRNLWGEQMSEQIEGGCLCSAVRFVAREEPLNVAWCHCQSCRKHSGAPVSVFLAVRRDAFEVTKGEITKFNSSPGRWRGFCARCGSTLTCEGEPNSAEVHLHIGSIDQAERFAPTRHIFPEERLPWLHLSEAP